LHEGNQHNTVPEICTKVIELSLSELIRLYK